MASDEGGDDRPRSASPLDEWEGEPPHALADLVNRVLDRGVVVGGDVTISVAGVDLVYLGLHALLTSVSTARRTFGQHGAASGSGLTRGTSLGAVHGGTERGAGEALASGTASMTPSGAAPPSTPPVSAATGERQAAGDALAAELSEVARALPDRIDVDPESVQRDLARLVMVIVELLRRVVEHQAIQRMDDDDLSEEQVERMGLALAALEDKMKELQGVFGLADTDLNIDLGPLGKLL